MSKGTDFKYETIELLTGDRFVNVIELNVIDYMTTILTCHKQYVREGEDMVEKCIKVNTAHIVLQDTVVQDGYISGFNTLKFL